METVYDCLIVGGGVSGTSLLYVLSKYTNVKKIKLIEKYGELAQVNSKGTNNSQTLHFGDIETNYTLEKARTVKANADLVRNYLEDSKQKGEQEIFSVYPKMVLAVGDAQVNELSLRYKEFKALFPELREIKREEIAKIEPRVVEGRDPAQKIKALYSPNGYTVDYGALSKSFAKRALEINKQASIAYNTKLCSIEKKKIFYVETSKGLIKAKTVVVATGGHSLLIAHQFGCGKKYAILSVAGSFYCTPHKVLNGKVYTMQAKKLPFAAIHGDPDVHNEDETRFGPTAKAIPFLERYKIKSFFEYFKIFGLRTSAILTPFKILGDYEIFKYITRNTLYDVPFIGPRMFLQEVRQIVPSIKLRELRFAHKVGGTRPQIMNTETKKLEMGEAKIQGEGIIFNITPSPGASTCLGNAKIDAKSIVNFLGNKIYRFNEKEFTKDLANEQ